MLGMYAVLLICVALRLTPDFTSAEYLTYEDCVAESEIAVNACWNFTNCAQSFEVKRKCTQYKSDLQQLCQGNCGSGACIDCFKKRDVAIRKCQGFMKKVRPKVHSGQTPCVTLGRTLEQGCVACRACTVCQDGFCRNGGRCSGGPNPVSCRCPAGFRGIFCHKDECKTRPCQNGGTCVGPNRCKCASSYTGQQCEQYKVGTKFNPAPNAKAILDAKHGQTSGLYWIQPPGEASPAQTYCDMAYDGGGWMLASYGYVHQAGTNNLNKAIPNMNYPGGFTWLPTERASSNGLIALPHGAVQLARNADWLVMAAGNNPASGGINSYTHIYRIDLRNNPWNITFKNHNRFHGATGDGGIEQMHITPFFVEALKGESGRFVRFALGEALGVTYGDSYPTGYGFYDIIANYSGFNKGPFFPSVHSGDGTSKCSCGPTGVFHPDVSAGKYTYNHQGWFGANTVGNTGQTSIWFK